MSATSIDDGGPAFPIPGGGCPASGISIRDYFAAAALAGTAANPSFRNETWKEHAAASYRAADAMLAARKGAAQ
jgi:hypothetical protein